MISIRRELPEDIGSIRAVNEAAFGQRTEGDIVDALRDACPDLLSLVAESDDETVDHILFAPVTIEDGSGTTQGMELAPMAVIPNRQRQSIGSNPVEAGLEILREQGCPFIIATRASVSFRRPVMGFAASGRLSPTRRSWCSSLMKRPWPA